MSDIDPLPLPRWLRAALVAGPAAFLAAFYAWPLVTLLREAVTVGAVTDTFGRAATWEVAWFTTWMAVASTIATVVVALPATWIVARYEFAGRRLLVGIVTALFVLPTVVMGAAVLAVLPAGVGRSVWAIIVAHALFNLAVVIRTVGAAWEQLPADLEHAAATLGAGRTRSLRTITLPLLAPTLLGAATIVFVFSFTSFGVIRILAAPGTRTIEVEVWRRATQLGDIGDAAVLSMLQLGLLAVVVAASARAQRRRTLALGLSVEAPRQRPRTPSERRTVGVIGLVTAAAALIPLVAMGIRSLSTPTGWSAGAWRTLGRTEVRPGIGVGVDPTSAIAASLVNAVWATAFAVTIGALAALAIAASPRAGRLLDVGSTLPIATSAVTIGFGILITFDVAPFDWRDEWWLVPIGQAMVALPFVVRATVGALRAIDPMLARAAASLGASPAVAWQRVVVPHLWRPLAIGAGLAAAISLGEFGATTFLSRRGDETLPIVIERLLGRTGSVLQAQGYALATILAATTIVIVVAIELAQRPNGHDTTRP